MDQLLFLIRSNSSLLGDQPLFEIMVEQLSEPQAVRLAKILRAFIRDLKASKTSEPAPTLH